MLARPPRDAGQRERLEREAASFYAQRLEVAPGGDARAFLGEVHAALLASRAARGSS